MHEETRENMDFSQICLVGWSGLRHFESSDPQPKDQLFTYEASSVSLCQQDSGFGLHFRFNTERWLIFGGMITNFSPISSFVQIVSKASV